MSLAAAILAIERRTTGFAMWCAVAMLVIAAFSGLYQIVSRFILAQPAEWTEVIVRFSLIWMVFLGIPTAFRQGAMVSVDLLYQYTSGWMRRAMETMFLFTSLILMLVIMWWGYEYAWRTRFQTIPGLEDLTMFWAYVAMPVGAAFSLLSIVGQWLEPRHRELETAL